MEGNPAEWVDVSSPDVDLDFFTSMLCCLITRTLSPNMRNIVMLVVPALPAMPEVLDSQSLLLVVSHVVCLG